MCGIPCLDRWEILLARKCPLVVHEDNQSMLRVIETGRNPTMRYLGRTHRVSVRRLHEAFKRDNIRCVYAQTDRMAGDIYTKAFADSDKWIHAQELIHVMPLQNRIHTLMTTQPRHPRWRRSSRSPPRATKRTRRLRRLVGAIIFPTLFGGVHS